MTIVMVVATVDCGCNDGHDNFAGNDHDGGGGHGSDRFEII